MITEEKFLPFFQKDISIMLDNKILRQGRLLLFSIKDFYLHFTLLAGSTTKNFELPYPFNAYEDKDSNNILILDYKIKSFTRDLTDIYDKTKTVAGKYKHMKYFDNVVRIIETC